MPCRQNETPRFIGWVRNEENLTILRMGVVQLLTTMTGRGNVNARYNSVIDFFGFPSNGLTNGCAPPKRWHDVVRPTAHSGEMSTPVYFYLVCTCYCLVCNTICLSEEVHFSDANTSRPHLPHGCTVALHDGIPPPAGWSASNYLACTVRSSLRHIFWRAPLLNSFSCLSCSDLAGNRRSRKLL